jgi:adenylosuccinate synthase
VLDAFDEINVCIGYAANGRRLKTFPSDVKTLEQVQPVYETFAGWKTNLSSAKQYSELPLNTRTYLNALADLTGTETWIVSVGPRRDQTFYATK